RKVELTQPEAEADRADDDRDRRHQRRGEHHAAPVADAQVLAEEMRGVRPDAERRGMEHRELAGVAEDEIEAHREHPLEESEYQDGEDEIALRRERQREERSRDERRAGEALHRRPAKRPAGLKSKISTRNTSP